MKAMINFFQRNYLLSDKWVMILSSNCKDKSIRCFVRCNCFRKLNFIISGWLISFFLYTDSTNRCKQTNKQIQLWMFVEFELFTWSLFVNELFYNIYFIMFLLWTTANYKQKINWWCVLVSFCHYSQVIPLDMPSHQNIQENMTFRLWNTHVLATKSCALIPPREKKSLALGRIDNIETTHYK